MSNKPSLSFWQLWNVSFGFLGVQFGFALQNANVSRILTDLGADLHSLSLFWIVAPLMGLIVQPIVGAASDRTWCRLGRRKPYILFGAIAAAIGMLLMPNAPLFVSVMAPMLFGALMLALMDASFNVSFQPFRSLVADLVPEKQRNIGYGIQAVLINIGAVIGSMLPFILTNVVGLDNVSKEGQVADSVVWAFYIGATVLLGSVLWTVFKTEEYPPQTTLNDDEVKPPFNLLASMRDFWSLVKNMPKTMKQLAVVQFFSWFALFIMWVYTTSAITQQVWGIETQWFDPDFLTSGVAIPESIGIAKGQAGDWVGILFAAYSLFAVFAAASLAPLADRLGRKTVYAGALLLGAVGYFSFGLIPGGEPVELNMLVTIVTVPSGAIWLLLPMIGVGIAWAAILAMPYAILAGSLPAEKTGVYMGVFNFTIAAPQIVSGLTAGWLVTHLFDNDVISIIYLAAVAMLLAAVAVLFVDDKVAE